MHSTVLARQLGHSQRIIGPSGIAHLNFEVVVIVDLLHVTHFSKSLTK